MGLFGYNKRDFEKNTEKFKKRIENIVALAPDFTKNFTGDKRSKFMGYLIRCANDLTIITYNEQGSDYEVIDKEINNILANIEEALSKKEGGSAVGYAELLYDEIDCCRRYGKNVFSNEEREAKWRKTVIVSKIADIIDRKEELAKRKEKILGVALKSSEEMMEKYKVEYDVLCSEEENLVQQLEQYHDLYKSHIAYMNALESKKITDKFNPDKLFGKIEDVKKELEALDGYGSSNFKTIVNDARANKGEATPKNEEVKCSYCGSHNYAGEQYCKQCGQALER